MTARNRNSAWSSRASEKRAHATKCRARTSGASDPQIGGGASLEHQLKSTHRFPGADNRNDDASRHHIGLEFIVDTIEDHYVVIIVVVKSRRIDSSRNTGTNKGGFFASAVVKTDRDLVPRIS